MANSFIKAEKVVATSLGLLRRELVLPRLVWNDGAFADVTLAKGDTVSIRLPAYTTARTRLLRAGAPRIKDQLNERKVDVSLSTDVYKDIGITDEQLTLDIADFGGQVLNPVTVAIAEQLEQEVLNTIEGATYSTVLTHTLASSKPYETVVNARMALNDARIPVAGRALAIGSAFEAALLKDPQFVQVQQSGTDSVLRESLIGRIAGFDVFSAPGIAPNIAVAFHRTAFAMVQRAPIVPAGAPWGATLSYQGLAMRAVRVFDPDLVEDRFLMDSWIGCTPVRDDGYVDGNGRFVPTSEPGATLGPTSNVTAAASTDLVTTPTAHGYKAGDRIRFASLAGGGGLSTATDYFVLPSGLTSTAFKVSTTAGGATADITTDYSGGVVAKYAAPSLVRAVKIVVV